MSVSRRLLFLVTEDWYFCSHRLPLAVEAAKAGFEVSVATRVRAHGEQIEREGIRAIPFLLGRRVAGPGAELIILWHLVRLYRRERPAVVYHVGLKPVVYGSIAARIAGIAGRVNAIAGLGYVFTSRQWKARLVRPFVRLALRLVLGGRMSRTIVQNREDERLVLEMTGGDLGRVVRIAGAGVDLRRFTSRDEQPGEPLILYAGRILWDKGVGHFIEAARQLRGEGVRARFVLAGMPDDDSPVAVPVAQIENWQRSGVIEWWGRRDDMPAVFAACHVVCLPSFYGEGIPKVLIEAAASGRAIVATDIPGCREIVKDGVNGLLVRTHDVKQLAQAIGRLIDDPSRRRRMGAVGRKLVESEYGVELINQETIAVIKAATA